MALQAPSNWLKSPPFLDQMSLGNRILHHILGRIFQYRDITKEDVQYESQFALVRRANGTLGYDGFRRVTSLYLRRFYIIRKGPFKLFLHFINRSDNDRHMHDHPWDFSSLILSGGYMEELPPWFPRVIRNTMFIKAPNTFSYRKAKPFSIVKNKAEHLHRVQLHYKEDGTLIPAWTLVHAGEARRVWGFLDDNGWKDWRTYLGLQNAPDSEEDI